MEISIELFSVCTRSRLELRYHAQIRTGSWPTGPTSRRVSGRILALRRLRRSTPWPTVLQCFLEIVCIDQERSYPERLVELKDAAVIEVADGPLRDSKPNRGLRDRYKVAHGLRLAK